MEANRSKHVNTLPSVRAVIGLLKSPWRFSVASGHCQYIAGSCQSFRKLPFSFTWREGRLCLLGSLNSSENSLYKQSCPLCQVTWQTLHTFLSSVSKSLSSPTLPAHFLPDELNLSHPGSFHLPSIFRL